jgi:polyphosphate glucokinase
MKQKSGFGSVKEVLGIDIGGTGIKGATVDLRAGKLTRERFRIETPHPATPDAVASTVNEIVQHFSWKAPIGAGFPAVVKKGVVYTAANIDKTWIGQNGENIFEAKTGCKFTMLNDADAAGIAEMHFGAGKDQSGMVMMLTLGTGIGCAVFIDKVLLPNTELGHLRIRGKDAERRASDSARERKGYSWKKWARRINEYLEELDRLLWPDLIIIGGGVSQQWSNFGPLLKTRAKVVPAKLGNLAGIIGAAMATVYFSQTHPIK